MKLLKKEIFECPVCRSTYNEEVTCCACGCRFTEKSDKFVKVNPCIHCQVGWGNYSTEGLSSCRDSCGYYKEYIDSLKYKI
jgi:hypothetical protein